MPSGARAEWKNLSKALQSGTVTITKGIHQRDAKVHFDVQSSTTGGLTFHVFVAAAEAVKVMSSPGIWGPTRGKAIERTLYKYSVTGLSFQVGSMAYLYPSQFTMLSEVEKPIGRPRGKSFSLGNSTAVFTALEQTVA